MRDAMIHMCLKNFSIIQANYR